MVHLVGIIGRVMDNNARQRTYERAGVFQDFSDKWRFYSNVVFVHVTDTNVTLIASQLCLSKKRVPCAVNIKAAQQVCTIFILNINQINSTYCN